MNGILLIDKPEGWTSNDIVQKLRGMLRTRRIGHSGTLDPMATGLLVVFVGRATRAVEFAEQHDKRYVAGLRLGQTTDTQDITGNTLASDHKLPTEEELVAALDNFKGEISQIPPMYSAIKVNGQRLYEIARKGGEVERKARNIKIHSLELMGKQDGDYVLDVRCSKGTYIRTLCHDLGNSLGCGGCMSSLRRIEAGRFSLENAVTLEQVQDYVNRGEAESLLMPVDKLFDYCPEFSVNEAQEKKLRCGSYIDMKLDDGEYRVYSQSGEFLLLGAVKNNVLTTVKSFFEV